MMLLTLSIAGVFCGLAWYRYVWACGGTPPPPVCSSSLVLTKTSTTAFVGPAGGVIPIDVELFFSLVPGVPPCEPPPYMATVTIDVGPCTPAGPGGTGTVVVPITPGFTTVTVPVFIPGGGPVRICTVTGSATVAFASGATLTATGDQVVCLGEPAPGNPSVPRLNMEHLTSETIHVHPGDHARPRVLITNNDPTESFVGVLWASTNNTAKLPIASGFAPGSGAHGIADPGEGDDPPLLFGDELPEDCCVELPHDPQNSVEPSISRTVILAPGESREVEVVVRPWGMCANGSCSELKIVLDGVFTDGTDGLACAGVAVIVNTAVTPTYECEESGKATLMDPHPDLIVPIVRATGEPLPDSSWIIETELLQTQLFDENGVPVPSQKLNVSLPLDPEWARMQSSHIFLPPQPPQQFQIITDYHVRPDADLLLQVQTQTMEVVPGAPSGFETLAPILMGTAQVIDLETGFQSIFDIFVQLSIEATAVDGTEGLPLHILEIGAAPSPKGFQVFMAVEAPVMLAGLTLFSDFRGYARRGNEKSWDPLPICGDGVCDDGEDEFNCPEDCVPEAECPADLTNSDSVGVPDLLVLLSCWGPVTPGCEAADLTNSGSVGVPDLLVLLSEWGPCATQGPSCNVACDDNSTCSIRCPPDWKAECFCRKITPINDVKATCKCVKFF